MTFLEKAMEIDKSGGREQHPNALIRRNCPFDYGLEEGDVCNRVGQEKCFDCWNREMPNTEEVAFTSNYHYDKGLNDAWELAKKLFGYQAYGGLCGLTVEKIYGTYNEREILEKYTPQEALAKLKAYEEAQNKIEIGDVVKSTLYVDMNCGIVVNITDDKASLIHKDGKLSIMVPLEFLVKTGKHIDISSILEQIGE